MPLLLYIVLRPENYGLTPNPLDPIFYSGYAINFDDVMNSVGDRHYFVSRWSVYYPGYLANALAGPFVGRLLWRLVLAAAILCSLWFLGRRFQWSRAQQFLVGTIVLAMPFFIRAFFTDYTEHIVVALGICLVCLCLRERHTVVSGLTIGVLVGLILVANPISISVVISCTLVALVMSATWRRRAILAALIAVGTTATVLGGLVLFRWRYGIDNVYRPTIDFIRIYQQQVPDPFKDSRLLWLGNFTWLYAPPILLLGTVAVARVRKIKLHRVEVAALLLCGVQYVSQWLDQFVRGGYGLELSFYWAYMYPAFAVALALVVARITQGCRSATVIAVGIGWTVFMLVGVPGALRLPSGLVFGLLAIVVLAVVAVLARRALVVSLVVLVALIGWTQIGAPQNDPSAHVPMDVAPHYDRLFRRAEDPSEVEYREAVWFEEQMDHVANDASTSFVPVGGSSNSIIGLYSPHVVDKVVRVGLDGAHLAPGAIQEIESGARPIVAVYGPPASVAAVIATFPKDLGVGTPLLEVTHRSALGYRLAVFAMPDASRLPFTFRPDALFVAQGHFDGTGLTVDSSNAPGFVTYGPYVSVAPGRYQVTLRYSAAAESSSIVGSFDVVSPESTETANSPLTGTNGVPTEKTLVLVVKTASRWEFRSIWSGIGELTIESFTLSR